MKNVILEKDFRSRQARGERLRRLRNMANLSREELCNINTLNIHTYKGWETGRFGGLSVPGAKEVIKRVAKEGVICSLDWLLNGQGCGPFIIADTSSIYTKNNIADISSDYNKKNNDISAILQEITVFQNNFKEGIFLEILDDGVLPEYDMGDYVAGIKKYNNEINSLIGNICIVQTANNEVLVRQLLKGTLNNTYTLVCINPKTTVASPVLSDIKIHSAALIIRHYKRHNLA